MVVAMVALLKYWPLAAAGLALAMASRTVSRLSLIHIFVRDIVDEVVRVGGDVLAGTGKRLADLVHLGRDGADVVDEGLQVVVGVAAQAADLSLIHICVPAGIFANALSSMVVTMLSTG